MELQNILKISTIAALEIIEVTDEKTPDRASDSENEKTNLKSDPFNIVRLVGVGDSLLKVKKRANRPFPHQLMRPSSCRTDIPSLLPSTRFSLS